MTGLIISVVILCAIILVLIILLRQQSKRQSDKPQDYTQSFMLIQQRIGDIEQQVKKSIDEGNRNVGNKFEDSLKVIGEIKKTIGSIEQTNRQMLDIGKNIESLQDLLKPPAIRGGLGELTLGNILAQILPKEHFEEKYSFRNGTIVDAVVRIGNKLVPIDSKFPIESFQRYIKCAENEKKSYLGEFERSIKAKIDDISSKYILTDENTYDFALMYIPSENVYYQTILKEDFKINGKNISDYAIDKKIVVVSPNSIYAYLTVIYIGLRGMQFEKNAKKIMDDFSRLNKEFTEFEKEFGILGTHLKHARDTHSRADRKLDSFSSKLKFIEQSQETKVIDEPKDSI